ncbi:MAG: hypothetical protein KAT91_02395 [Candidatus Aenigmarchaeota archaeon]|nr:hypothetical protein [Candidatus Aenigmarchaeota archaeon]
MILGLEETLKNTKRIDFEIEVYKLNHHEIGNRYRASIECTYRAGEIENNIFASKGYLEEINTLDLQTELYSDLKEVGEEVARIWNEHVNSINELLGDELDEGSASREQRPKVYFRVSYDGAHDSELVSTDLMNSTDIGPIFMERKDMGGKEKQEFLDAFHGHAILRRDCCD